MKIKLLRSQAGFTITELMVSIVISGILMFVAATGFITFFTKFTDLSKTIEIQRDAFNCLQIIKGRVPIGSGANFKFSGVATADSIQIVGLNQQNSKRIILYPGSSNSEHANDYLEIYWYNYVIYAKYLDGNFQPPAKAIFPSNPLLARKGIVQVTNLNFSKANPGENLTKIINVDIDARILVRGKQYKTVSYSTKMAVSID